MKTLYFEGAGWSDTDSSTNVGNCRIRTAFTNDDGRQIYLEMSSGKERARNLWKQGSMLYSLDQEYRQRCESKYSVIGMLSMDDQSITIRCHASDKAIGDKPRVITIPVNY